MGEKRRLFNRDQQSAGLFYRNAANRYRPSQRIDGNVKKAGIRRLRQPATENMKLANDVVANNSDLITYNTEHVDENTVAVDESSDAYSDATIKTEDTALKHLQNTLDTITESTARQIDSQVSGFDKVGRCGQRARKARYPRSKVSKSTLRITRTLRLAKTMGYSEEVISALSDGSTDSASKLAGLVKANETQIAGQWLV